MVSSIAACAIATTDALAEKFPTAFVEGAIGAGVSAGTLTYASTNYVGARYFDRTSSAGPLVDLTASTGAAWREFAFGAAFDATLMQSFWKESNGSTAIVSASAIAVLRDAISGVQGSMALGYASGGELTCTTLDAGQGSSGGCGTSMTGPRLALRFGYAWPSGVGFATTGSYTYLFSGDSSFKVLTMAVQGTLSSW
jgi:hypothetical protein